MVGSILLSSSLRETSPEQTIEWAKVYAARLGITRVTDITRLDRVGVPVFASIRPTAITGSLCVNAGKGRRAVEARAGAYMEAIEYAMSEPGASPVAVVKARARDVLDGHRRHDAILDLCPKLGTAIRLDRRVSCVEATDIVRGTAILLPAELVFFPFTPPRGETSYFGAGTNGVASGNSVREATVHALTELIERDITSFEAVRDTSVPVDPASVTGAAAWLMNRVTAAGLEVFVRAVRSVFGMPYFKAILHDPDSPSPNLLNAGYGCHPHRGIALVRAISEALQSRLSCIHGGRDDLTRSHDRTRRWRPARKRDHVRRAVIEARGGTAVPLGDILDRSAACTGIESCERFVIGRLYDLGFDRILRVAFTRPGEKLQVVRLIVPRLEVFNDWSLRFGLRLREHARKS